MKSSHKKYKYTSEELAEILFKRMFKKRYSGNEKVFNNCKFIIHSDVKNAKNFILEKLRSGADIRTGYCSTSVRGFHRFYILEGGFSE